MVVTFVLMLGGQDIGVLVINNYSVLIYQSLGLSNTIALMLAALWLTMTTTFNIVGAFISDKIGRRGALKYGYLFCSINLLIATAMIAEFSETGSHSFAIAAVFFIFLYGFFYGPGIDIPQFSYCAEVFPSHLRTQGNSLALSALFLADVLWLNLTPLATASIGWKWYIVFVVLGFAHTAYIWYYLPDTTGLALEEIDALFGMESAGHLDDMAIGNENDAYDEKPGNSQVVEKV